MQTVDELYRAMKHTKKCLELALTNIHGSVIYCTNPKSAWGKPAQSGLKAAEEVGRLLGEFVVEAERAFVEGNQETILRMAEEEIRRQLDRLTPQPVDNPGTVSVPPTQGQ